jgi:hypothetical protein
MESDNNDMSELFRRNPLALTDNDIDRIIVELRKQRQFWDIKEKEPKKKAEPKVAIDLDAIGL